MMKKVLSKTWYLQMKKKPEIALLELEDELQIIKAEFLSVDFYKFIYTEVGREWSWCNRLAITEEELEKIITHPKVDIYIFYVNDIEAGFYELDRRINEEVEIKYFGLAKNYIGKGYGKLLIEHALFEAWLHNPKRVWLHTCDLDAPQSLSFYQKAGFDVYDEKMDEQIIPA